MSAVDLARNTPGVVAVSMSWGFSETASETAFDSHFQTPAGHQGVTFLAASGDNGTANGPDYPSSSPRVVAVGGTTLTTDLSGNYVGEATWSGSGGGYSPYEPEPIYQATVQTTHHRSTPDVAFVADPNTGVEVYETPPRQQCGIMDRRRRDEPGHAGLGRDRRDRRSGPGRRRGRQPRRAHPDPAHPL